MSGNVALAARLLRAAMRDLCALLGRRVDRRVCDWANETGGDDD